jgi:hypothetical protein
MTNIAWAAEQKSLDAITSDRRARAVKANATKAALDEEEAKARGQAAVVWAATNRHLHLPHVVVGWACQTAGASSSRY